MTINKLLNATDVHTLQQKTNEVIDAVNSGGGTITVDQTYDASSSNAQSGVAMAGANFIQNTATLNTAVTIVGTASTKVGSVNVGVGTSTTANYGTAIGHNAKTSASSALAAGRASTASGSYAVALGYGATASGGKAIQLGYGTNSTATSLSVGFQDVGNYQLLDGTTGKIPTDRIDVATSVSSSSTNAQVVGAKLLYDSLSGKQATLVSGTNIKTINNESLLGSGNITISGGGGIPALRNIGEIVTSTTPLTDAGLHLLDGSLLSSSNYADFVTYIAGIYSSYSSLFTTESAWQTEVTNTGVCDKFVYNSTNNTVRLPKYDSKVYTGGGQASVIGNDIAIGLVDYPAIDDPDCLGLTTYDGKLVATLSNYGAALPTVNSTINPINANIALGLSQDATKSGIIADLSSITTTLDVYYYIVIRNSIADLATVATSGSYNDLSNKPTIPAQTDVKINNTSITSSGVANIVTNGTYNATSNKIATMSDVPAVNNATLTITQGGVSKGTFTANASSNVTIALDAGGGSGGSTRNIGEMVVSTIPLTDAGLHLLDGSLLSSGSYADFVTYIAGLVSSNPTLFTTESDWQTEVTNTGYCDKFVYDSTNNTVRLPKWGSQLITNLSSTVGVKGDGKSLGLSNGSTNYGIVSTSTTSYLYKYDLAYGASIDNSTNAIGTSGQGVFGVTTDASKSGMVADLSGIAKSNVYYYIVIANITKTAIEVDIDEITTDLNGKMDVDMSNMNASSSAKKIIDNWCSPDYSSGVSMGLPSQPTSATTTTYTCPSAGVCVIAAHKSTAGNNFFVDVNNETVIIQVAYNAMGVTATFPVSKNDVVKAYTNYAGNGWALSTQTFFPLKGEA